MLNFCLRFKFFHFLPVHYVCVSTLLLARPALLNLPLCPNQWPQLSQIIVRASVGQCFLVSKLVQKEILRKQVFIVMEVVKCVKKNMKIIHVITSHCLMLTFHCILVIGNYIYIYIYFFFNTQYTVLRLHIPISFSTLYIVENNIQLHIVYWQHRQSIPSTKLISAH